MEYYYVKEKDTCPICNGRKVFYFEYRGKLRKKNCGNCRARGWVEKKVRRQRQVR